jgi:esterase/lipase superfamily enzyme
MHGDSLETSRALALTATVTYMTNNIVVPAVNFTEPANGRDRDYVHDVELQQQTNAAISDALHFLA